jgi:hypothetical protein
MLNARMLTAQMPNAGMPTFTMLNAGMPNVLNAKLLHH